MRNQIRSTARRRVRTRQQAQVLLPAQSATRPEKPVYRFDDNSPCGRKCKPHVDEGASPPGHRDRTTANGTAEPTENKLHPRKFHPAACAACVFP